MNSRGIIMSEAFSAGLGAALGLVMGQCMFQSTRPPEKVAVKRVLVCQECSAQNPVENKFCGNCGRSLYPPLKVICQEYNSKMPTSMKYCGNCGSILKRYTALGSETPETKKRGVKVSY